MITLIILSIVAVAASALYLDHKAKAHDAPTPIKATGLNALDVKPSYTGGELALMTLAVIVMIAFLTALSMGYIVAIGTLFAATNAYVLGITVTKTAAYTFGVVALVNHAVSKLSLMRRIKRLEDALKVKA